MLGFGVVLGQGEVLGMQVLFEVLGLLIMSGNLVLGHLLGLHGVKLSLRGDLLLGHLLRLLAYMSSLRFSALCSRAPFESSFMVAVGLFFRYLVALPSFALALHPPWPIPKQSARGLLMHNLV